MKTLFLIISCCLTLTLSGDEDRIWMDATLNGQRVHLYFDTGTTDSTLFRTSAERLKLKLMELPAGFRTPLGGKVNGQMTEPLNFTYEASTGMVQFVVIDLPPLAEADADGILSWYPLKQKVFIFDATKQRLDIGDSMPQNALGWQKFKQATGSQILGFDIGGEDPQHHTVYVDTGAYYGVALNRSLWEKWIATRTNQPATIRSIAFIMTGMLEMQEMWASEISIGSLILKEVPVRELDVKEEAAFPNHAATLGLFALRRLDLVVDGPNGVVYERPLEGPAPDYPHNQLGAVFPPKDSQSDARLARVAPNSPAYLAGIRDNDELLKIDDLDATKWRTDPRLRTIAFWELPAGTTYKLTLKRGEREYQTNVTLKKILGSGLSPVSTVTKVQAQQIEADKKLLIQVSTKAGNGDAQAQAALGNIFLFGGLGVVQDNVEAVKWTRLAAEANYDRAQYILGCFYCSGQGMAKSDVEALKWWRKAAEQNFAEAQYSLGFCYAAGQGVAKDYTEAAKWFRRAAEQNFAKAQYSLGICYADGAGVVKDFTAAAQWFGRAAEQNLALAQRNLGQCYYNGQGVAKDYTEAVKWLRRAAEQNNAEAQFILGNSYYTGQGVAKDEVDAYKWSLLTSGQGLNAAKQIVRELEVSLTAKQILEGQKLARNFRPLTKQTDQGISILLPRPESSSTGFFITENGYLITREIMAQPGTQVRLIVDAGLIFSARVVKVDATNNLALLKAEGKFAALPVASSGNLDMGSAVATVGFPKTGLQGFAPKPAKGKIISLAGEQDDPRYFQINVPVQAGNSGGALVDNRGNVVGVVSGNSHAVATGQLSESPNYALKGSLLLSFLQSVPEVAAKLKEPIAKENRSEDVVKSAEQATVLVLTF